VRGRERGPGGEKVSGRKCTRGFARNLLNAEGGCNKNKDTEGKKTQPEELPQTAGDLYTKVSS